ncbi:Ig-like domain-containing protein [Myxococcus sp. NMCA1]|uniref:Ig-like domain-containing protein n=1 Tax=Myxococcus sp. NMCA1 TaxID=2996785 RepID=UPI002285AB4C|nr:Ig-like domain-containing protein [Myxococcus sp. NMCA1]WAM30051.1 glycoside hydrolase family 88 protein [Myxococcus sp. NMCA1]
MSLLEARRERSRLRVILCAVVLGCANTANAQSLDAAPSPDPLEARLPATFAFAASRLRTTAESLPPGAFPQETRADGTWVVSDATSFTSGFLAGSLWYMYEYTGDAYWHTQAERWQAPLRGQATRTDDHDLGFVLYSSFGNGYRLTGDPSYRALLLTAANSLSQRYYAPLGYVRSRGDITDLRDLDLIIDTMMNLELLFWASRNGGSPALREMATRHALNTLESHSRSDGSTFQVARFDPLTGALKEQGKEQGCRYETVWSRGQAWAIYGYTVAYRETRDRRFLQGARKAADFYLSHVPGDLVAYWDFFPPDIPTAPRDVSAAAASALIELSQLESESRRADAYLKAARDILLALSSPAYLSEGTPFQSILLHGTAYKPRGRSDIGLVYADYYFLEALLRYRVARHRSLTSWDVELPPALIATRTPMPDAPVVSVDANVRVYFTAPMRGVDDTSFLLKRGSSLVAAEVSYDGASRVAVLRPREPLRHDTEYAVILSKDITGPDRRSLGFQRWTFTTEVGPPSRVDHRFFDFESGTLAGVDRVAGPVTLVSGAAALRGSYSVKLPGTAPAFLAESFRSTDDIYTSFLLRMDSTPTVDADLLAYLDDGEVLPHVLLRPNLSLQLMNEDTPVGTRTNFMTVGEVYSVALRQRDGGGRYAILDLYLRGPGVEFECPFASSWVRMSEPRVDQVRLGSTVAPRDVTLDDVRLDTER